MVNKDLLLNIAISGTVVRGKARARATGFPTINVAYRLARGAQAPLQGVYAAHVKRRGDLWRAAASVGSDWGQERLPKLELYVFGAAGEWYGESVDVILLKKMRDLARFKNAEDARTHIARDIEAICAFLDSF